MITINLSDKQAAELKSMLSIFEKPNDRAIAKEVISQINNQQFDVSDFESSRQYEAMSVNAAYLVNWDKATKQ
ncbi:hypothetical protein bas03_0074 [Escherichia phage JulesPiccard]|uniref:Uncharacterized protein n=1 Tax=Escherichia phage JulesPiccard TaxID=2851956 RepID=A0AAE7VV40_9CAUD|nr:hypothetical protein bas03_0074 [Escherichia phage JulesPiccard]